MTQHTPHVGINGQLLSTSQSYRSAGVSGYIRQLLAQLPVVAPDLRVTAFVPEAECAMRNAECGMQNAESGSMAGGVRLRGSRWDTRRPWRRILWEQLALPLLSLQVGLDLVHAPVNVSPWLSGCPAVVTVHDLSFVRYPQAFPPMQRLYLRSQARRSARSARRIIAVSQATRRDVAGLLGAPAERVDVVYNGVDAAFRPAPASEVAEFRRRKGLPERFILHLGTLEPRKNLVRLVQAFDQVRRQAGRPAELKLVLAGGRGWDYAAIFQEVARLGLGQEVLFPGYVPDQELPWWYRSATVFAYPSLLEGFGLPVVEAMACGTPVVTSNTSSLPEVAGEAALLVDPASSEMLADALQAVLSDPALAQNLAAAGLAQAGRFSWQRTARETAAVYRSALDNSGGVA